MFHLPRFTSLLTLIGVATPPAAHAYSMASCLEGLNQSGVAELVTQLASLQDAAGAGMATSPTGSPISFLPETDRAKILSLLDESADKKTRAAREETYSRLVRPQIIQDLTLLYTSSATQVTYASFTSDETPGDDGGFGLHVVKRLDVGNKTVLVNEHWPFRRGRLQLPDEIRVRTRGFDRKKPARGQSGSEEDFVFERFRIAWDAQDKPTLYTQRQFTPDGRSEPHRVQTGVFDCAGCHRSGNPFSTPFTPSGSKSNPETITQKPGFAPLGSGDAAGTLRRNTGLRDFLAYLSKKGYSGKHRAATEATLIGRPLEATRLPNILSLLQEHALGPIMDYVQADRPLETDPIKAGDGAYTRPDGTLWQDGLEAGLYGSENGKGRYWNDNQHLIPSVSEVPDAQPGKP